MQRVVFLPLEPVDGRLHDGVRRLGRLLAVDPQADLLLLKERLEVQHQDVDLPGGLQVDLQLLLRVLDEAVHRLVENIDVLQGSVETLMSWL